MIDVLSDEIVRFVRIIGPDPDNTLIKMDEYATAEGFPHTGPEVGAMLYLLAHMTDARRVFEFGSGFGYSAYWLAKALPNDGDIILTEVDQDELDLARHYMTEGGFDTIAQYELGDALETIERHNGPFDVVLIDHQKHSYLEAFNAVRKKIPVGGVVVADNAIVSGSIEFEKLLAVISGDERNDLNESTQGIAEYLKSVTDDPAFETVVLPIGKGIAVSYRLE